MFTLLTNLLATSHTGSAAGNEVLDLKPPEGQYTKLSNLTFGGILSNLIRFSLVAAGILFFFMLLIGGIKWILSSGDKTKTEGARSQITAALVGLVIVFSAWAIASLIEAFFGIDIINPGPLLNPQTAT